MFGGPNATINVNTLKPAFKQGKKTALDDITSCWRHPDYWKANWTIMIFPPWWDSVMRKVFGPALSVVSLPIALNGADREMTMVLCCAFRAQD